MDTSKNITIEYIGEFFDKKLIKLGFTKNKFTYTKELFPNVYKIFQYSKHRSWGYNTTWGISFSNMPILKNYKPFKVIKPDKNIPSLVYDSIDYYEFDDAILLPHQEKSALDQWGSIALERAEELWEKINNINDILDLFEEKIKYRKYIRFGFFNWIQQPFAYSLLFLKDKKNTEAEIFLEKMATEYNLNQDDKKLLQEGLSECLKKYLD